MHTRRPKSPSARHDEARREKERAQDRRSCTSEQLSSRDRPVNRRSRREKLRGTPEERSAAQEFESRLNFRSLEPVSRPALVLEKFRPGLAPVRLPGRRRDAGGPGRDLEGRGQRRGGRYRDPARRAGRRRDPGRARDRTGTRKTPGGRGPDARRDARDADPGTRPRRDGRRPRRARDPRGTRAGFRRDPHGRRRRRRTPDAARDGAGTRAGPGPDPRDATSGTRPRRRGTRPRPAADGAKDAGTARCLGAPP